MSAFADQCIISAPKGKVKLFWLKNPHIPEKQGKTTGNNNNVGEAFCLPRDGKPVPYDFIEVIF